MLLGLRRKGKRGATCWLKPQKRRWRLRYEYMHDTTGLYEAACDGIENQMSDGVVA